MRKGSSQAGHKLCPTSRTAVSATSLRLQRAFHTIPCRSPTLCRSAQPPQDSHVSSQDSFSTSPQYMLCLKKSLQKTALPEFTILPLFPTLNRQPIFSLVPTLSFKQCLSLPTLLIPLCTLNCSFQLSARLQEPVLSKTPNCCCLMRTGRSHHTKKSGHERKFQKWPQLSAF